MLPFRKPNIGITFEERYETVRKLGEGGSGIVFQARQLATGQTVALKVLRASVEMDTAVRDRRVARFEREMQLCARLHHPNIVRLIDSGKTPEGILYSVFEYIPGSDLAAVLQNEGGLEPYEARHLMLQVLDALSCAH